MVKRRDFIKKAGIGAATFLGSEVLGAPFINRKRPDKRPPNILLILTDQQRFDTIAAQRKTGMYTPNLDRLAAEGVRFDRAYCAQALCSPSRASIISGLYPHTHKVQENIYGIDDTLSMPDYNLGATWPLLLQQAGYRTCWIGKWHLGEKAPKCFDEWYGFNSLLSHWMGKYEKSEYRSDKETDIGLDFLERNKHRPFVLCQSYYPPHAPYTAPEEFVKLYVGKTQFRPAKYYAAISNIDMNVGRLLRKLEDLGLIHNTVVIFTSDHGEHFGQRPGGANKRGAYDDCARIPLIARYPGIFEGGLVKPHLVSNVDIMPTILDIAAVNIPSHVQGRSLRQLGTGKTSAWRSAVCVENLEATSTSENSNTCNSRGIRTNIRKLILRDRLSVRAECLRELYDSIGDPFEKNNIYGHSELSRIRTILHYLENWARETDDDVGTRLARECRTDLGIVES